MCQGRSTENKDRLQNELFHLLPFNIDKRSDFPKPMTKKEASRYITKALRIVGFEVNKKIEIKKVTSGPTLQQIYFHLPSSIPFLEVAKRQFHMADLLGLETQELVSESGGDTVFILSHQKRSNVYLHDLTKDFIHYAKEVKLPVMLGKDVAGLPIYFDLADQPNLLITGQPSSGKSVCLDSLISSIMLVRSPKEVKFLMIDPSTVELSVYNQSPHLCEPIISNIYQAMTALLEVAQDIEVRYDLLMKNGVRNIEMYNKKKLADRLELMAYTIIIVQELANLKYQQEAEVDMLIQRISQKAKIVGIHFILSTNSPHAGIVTDVIKVHTPSRICFEVAGYLEYQNAMDHKSPNYPMLLGRGDGVAKLHGQPNIRFQSAMIGNDEDAIGFIQQMNQVKNLFSD